MIENTATYNFLIENENQSLKHSFQRKIRTAKIHGDAGSDVEEDLDPLDARERKCIIPILRARKEGWQYAFACARARIFRCIGGWRRSIRFLFGALGILYSVCECGRGENS